MIPIMYYPTTTIFLDDNNDFLESLKVLEFSDKNIFTTNANIAMDHINKEKSKMLIIPKITNAETQDEYIQHHLQNVKKRIFIPNKESEISVLVIDYDMPQIDGISFCKNLNKVNSNIYKILLTGADKDDVISEALESGCIDFFLPKSNTNTLNKLKETIKNGKEKYFNNVCKEFRTVLLEKKSIKENINFNKFTSNTRH